MKTWACSAYLHLELAHLLLEPLDERIGEHARQRIARAILHQSVLCLGGDARRLGVGHAPSEIRQPLGGRVLVIVERDDGVLSAEVAERALRLRQLSFHASDLVLEEVPRLPGELELRLQALEDEAARVRVGDALREPGAGAGEADLDEARVRDRLHLEPVAVPPDQAGRNAGEDLVLRLLRGRLSRWFRRGILARRHEESERAQKNRHARLDCAHHAPATFGPRESRLVLESELPDDARRERAALEELHLILEELDALEVAGRRDDLGKVRHLRGLDVHVHHRPRGPEPRCEQTHHGHHGQARDGQAGHQRPAPPKHGEHLAQLGVARARRARQRARGRVHHEGARQGRRNDVEPVHLRTP